MAFYAPEYTWVFAFVTAIGIGANDLANSFGTTVGAKALKIWQVVILASICEFAGAVLLGAGVTSTIRSGVAKPAAFVSTPVLLMYGFMCVSATNGIIDNTATQLGLPVSTTHTVVGATVGMALALRGGSAVVWSKHKSDFPYITGMLPIFLSWVVSPIMSGIICSILYVIIRQFVLRSANGFNRAFYLLPVLVGGIAWLIASFIIQTGSKNETWAAHSDGFAVWVGAVCGVGCALFTVIFVMPILRRKVIAREERENKLAEQFANDPEGLRAAQQADVESGRVEHLVAKIPRAVTHNPVSNVLLYTVRKDVHKYLETDQRVGAVWEHAEVFDPKVEGLFRYLQVFSAAVMSFTHGANDVANAMGPYAAVYTIWDTGSIPTKSVHVPTWILVIGGAGISLGLAVFSYKILGVLGVRIVKVTNSRGFCAEYATAITVAVASRYGLPVSTTQVITGALLALGAWEGFKGINWEESCKGHLGSGHVFCSRVSAFLAIRVIATAAGMPTIGGCRDYTVFLGWVLTIFCACGIAAGLVAWGVNSPERRAVDQVQAAAAAYNTTNTRMLNILAANNYPNVSGLNASFYQAYAPVQKELTPVVDVNLEIFGVYNQTLLF